MLIAKLELKVKAALPIPPPKAAAGCQAYRQACAARENRAMQKDESGYTIKEVSEQLHIPRPTLRFWEKSLPGVLTPRRTIGGQRRYSTQDIQIIKEIRKLKDNGVSLREIRQRLEPRTLSLDSGVKHLRIDLLANRIADLVKSEIACFLQEIDDGQTAARDDGEPGR